MVQPVTNKDRQLVQKPIIAPMPTIVHVTSSLTIHIPKGSDHQPSNGGQLGDSPRGSSSEGDLLKEPPFNPPIGSYGWLAPNPRMFIPPWYQPPVVQPMSEPATKLPYRELQHPTYVKDTSLDAHIKVFKSEKKTNGEIVESNIINLFGSTLRDNINYVQDHPNYTFEKLEQTICN
jgi:hypothetical protein